MPSLKNIAIWAAIAFASLSAAHPGQDVHAEVEERAQFLKGTTNLQKKCGAKLQAKGYYQRAIDRRRSLAESIRKERGISRGKYLKARDLDTVLATDHNQTIKYPGVNMGSPQDDFFGDRSSCLLQPHTDLAEGPYYVSGEYVRHNVIEDQQGVEMMFDLQLIDVNTCEPVHEVYVDFWEANSTGVYSGTVGNDNGNPLDYSNINNTFLRGLQPTDKEGVAQIKTLFPGHYTPRTTHMHIIVHQHGKLLPNNTFSGGTISHVGQLFFDQDLINEVYTTYPYNTNDDSLMLNADDSVFIAEANTTDPVANYVYIGDEVTDGLVAWITVGVNTTANETVIDAVWYGAGGGVANPNAYTPPGAGGAAATPTAG